MLRPGRRAAVCVIAAGERAPMWASSRKYSAGICLASGRYCTSHLRWRMLIGQGAGLIRDIPAAGELGERIVAEAEALLKDRLPKLVWAS